MTYSKEEVKENLDTEKIYALLDFFNAEPEYVDDNIVCKTICHGGEKRKLYYYSENKLFMCYTECGKSFDIFELIQKVKGIDDLNSTINFVVNFFNLQYRLSEIEVADETKEDWKILRSRIAMDDYEIESVKDLEFDIYEEDILKYYPKPLILPWKKEGISKDACDYMGICYDPCGGNILIPHRNIQGDLIGIRQRTLIQEQEQYGKYRPWKHNKILYNHPLGFNLYGLDIAKENIEKAKMAIVVESEKSVLEYLTYFGVKNNLCVAVCGSALSKYQFNLLYQLGIKELVLGFDRDFEEKWSDDYIRVQQKFKKVYDKYSPYVNVSFLFDTECDTLGYKSSPLDEGKDKFLYLFRNRVIL